MATAWEPYQELFQGVIVCLHSDFRIGGLKPGETKTIRGKIYLMPADFPALLARYRRDFPEHRPPATPAAAAAPAKKLIEFGWDEPDTGFLRRHRAQLERTPFDGCVFHVDARHRRERRELHLARLGPQGVHRRRARSRRSTTWRRSRGRDAVPPQFPPIQRHAGRPRLVRRPCRGRRQRPAGRRACPRRACQGILLDTEPYQGKLFDTEAARRRPALGRIRRPGPHRGREVMTAFQEGFPDLTVFLTFGHSLVWKQSERGKKPLAECPDGLLVPFLDGMIEAASGQDPPRRRPRDVVRIPRAAAFIEARRPIKHDAAKLAADRAAYRRSSPPGSASGSITTGRTRAGNRRTRRRTTSPPTASKPASARPSSNPTSMSGSTPRNRAGGPKRGNRSTCRRPTSNRSAGADRRGPGLTDDAVRC